MHVQPFVSILAFSDPNVNTPFWIRFEKVFHIIESSLSWGYVIFADIMVRLAYCKFSRRFGRKVKTVLEMYWAEKVKFCNFLQKKKIKKALYILRKTYNQIHFFASLTIFLPSI